MRLICFIQAITICSIVAIIATAAKVRLRSPFTGDEENVSRFIVDTDAGVDDAMAILYLLGTQHAEGNVRVVGITCVNGNTALNNVLVNVLKTLHVANRLDIPIFKGANESILSQEERSDYFGEDGFGDFYYPNAPPATLVKKKHAVKAMVDMISNKPGQISIICLGPLTNIALAIRMYPQFLRDVKELFVLGSSLEGVGNVRPGVEFNFFVDPEAVYIVLKKAEEERTKITLIPWETVSLRGRIPMHWRLNNLGAMGIAVTDFINNAENKTLGQGDVWYHGDPMLAAVAVNSGLITLFEDHSISIETCGFRSRGAAFVDYSANRSTSYLTIVKEIDLKAYQDLFLKYMASARKELSI